MTGNNAGRGSLYFASPQQAVPQIATLLRQGDFATLAQYYDLSGTDIDRSTLSCGKFFIHEQAPQSAHPAGFWRYRQPFAPGFNYHGITPAVRNNTYVVTVMVKIEQADIPDQIGLDTFSMIESARGWQLLPKQAGDTGK